MTRDLLTAIRLFSPALFSNLTKLFKIVSFEGARLNVKIS